MRREAVRLRLSESRLRVALSLATPPLLVLVAWGAWAIDSPPLAVAVLALLAAGLGYVAAFDLPLAIEIGDDGMSRICLVRRQLIPWNEIASIAQPRKSGLLLVTTAKKRHILLDRALEPAELDLIRSQARLREVEVTF